MIIEYRTPDLFLADNEVFLEKREIENNLILGLCNGFSDKSQEQEGCVFISVMDGPNIKAVSIKTAAKAIVAAEGPESRYVKELAAYYREKEIDLKGVFGEDPYVNLFSDGYGKEPVIDMTLLVHRLTAINKLRVAPGRFEMTTSLDLDLVTDWSMVFEEEKDPAVRKSKDQVIKITRDKITAGDVFKWINRGNTVSIAAINRRTRHAGIVGLVYTPEEHRRSGYATSLVQRISEHILQMGFQYCGLFTDKANPTSNHIYQKIGYLPIAQCQDIGYR